MGSIVQQLFCVDKQMLFDDDYAGCNPQRMKLGKRIAQARNRLGLKQEELCERVNALLAPPHEPLTQQALSALENRNSASSIHIVRLADALGVSIRWLQDGVGTPASRDWPFSPDLWGAVARLTSGELVRAENTLRGFVGLAPIGAHAGNQAAA